MNTDDKALKFAEGLYNIATGDSAGNSVQAIAKMQVVLRQIIDSYALQSYPQTPVKGYTAQPDTTIALVNEFKQDEERLLRKIDTLQNKLPDSASPTGFRYVQTTSGPDQRWAAVARSHFEQGFMALNRAVFQPQRIKLPEDES